MIVCLVIVAIFAFICGFANLMRTTDSVIASTGLLVQFALQALINFAHCKSHAVTGYDATVHFLRRLISNCLGVRDGNLLALTRTPAGAAA